jgi:hypothetical protein
LIDQVVSHGCSFFLLSLAFRSSYDETFSTLLLAKRACVITNRITQVKEKKVLKTKDVQEDEQRARQEREQEQEQEREQERKARVERGRRKEAHEQARMVLATRTPLMAPAPAPAKKGTRIEQHCRPNRNVLAPGEEENDENGGGSRNQRNRPPSTHRVPQLLWNTPVKQQQQQQLHPGKNKPNTLAKKIFLKKGGEDNATAAEASGTTSREETLVAMLSTLQSKLKQQQWKINALEQRQQALRLYSR